MKQSKPPILRCNLSSFAKIVSDLLQNQIHQCLAKKDIVVCGIPGGRSVRRVLETLKSAALPWPKIHFFMLDERLVPPDDPENNFKQAQELLFADLIAQKMISANNLHAFVWHKTKTEQSVHGYAEELQKLGGRLDVLLLSSGEDGHIAGLFPQHPALRSKQPYFLTLADAPKPPKERMSATPLLLGKAAAALLLFAGKEKANALQAFLDPEISTLNCPAKLVQQISQYYVIATNS